MRLARHRAALLATPARRSRRRHWRGRRGLGEVRLKLYKGNVMVTGRESEKSLYSSTLVTFEDDKGAYDQKDAAGFIKLNALRLRALGVCKRKGARQWGNRGASATSSCGGRLRGRSTCGRGERSGNSHRPPLM